MTTRPNALSPIAPIAAPGSGIGTLARAIASAGRLLRTWHRDHNARLDLRRCMELEPRFARDIGLTYTEIAMAAGRPSWVSETWPNRFGV
jgi:uncharacterized protein YjiS (DUF1127 family)